MSSHAFGNTPEDQAIFGNSKFVIANVPFDGYNSYRDGSHVSPRVISATAKSIGDYDIDCELSPYDKGVHVKDVSEIFEDSGMSMRDDPKDIILEQRDSISEIMKLDKFVITLGGNRCASLGSINAACESFKNVTVIKFGGTYALNDETDDGHRFATSCINSRILESADKFILVGPRSAFKFDGERAKELFNDDDILTPSKLNEMKSEDLLEKWGQLNQNVYISFEFDVFDPSLLYEVELPEPGGLFWRETINHLTNIISNCNVVGADFVGYFPSPHYAGSEILVTRLIHKFMSLIAFHQMK